MRKFLFVAVALAVLTGCKTKERVMTVERVRTDTTYITKTQRDSVYVKDSTHVSERGGTVKIEHWHTRWRDREVHDTLYLSKTDSVPKPYPVVKEVEKPISRLDRSLMVIGLLAIMWFTVWVSKYVRKFLP